MSKRWMELLVQVPAALAEEASCLMVESGATAVEEREAASGAALLVTHFPFETGATEKLRSAESALSKLGIEKSAFTLRNLEDQDWVARSRGHFAAEASGELLWIRPPWDETPAPEGRRELIIEPGLAFGTGRHPSTRLALEAIERACGESPPARFLDVGAGSGILSAAALILGAESALALDLDPLAVELTEALAEKNGLAGQIETRIGTLERDVLGGWWGEVDFIAANIFLGPLKELAPQMAEALAPGGRGVLAGIGYEQADALAEAVEAAGLIVTRGDRLEEWASLEIKRR